MYIKKKKNQKKKNSKTFEICVETTPMARSTLHFRSHVWFAYLYSFIRYIVFFFFLKKIFCYRLYFLLTTITVTRRINRENRDISR